MKKFIIEFKEFLLASTFIDVAIGFLIAGAVKDLATSFTDSLITPIVMKLLSLIGVESTGKATTFLGIDFYIQPFITAIISFIILMFVAFTVIKIYAKMKDKFTKEEDVEIELTNEEKLLTEIRDLLKK